MAERHWVQANSSRFESLDYEPTTRTLFVRFHPDKSGNRSIYSYENVSPVVWEELLASESRGRYFNKIKNNPEDFPFKKAGTEPAEPSGGEK